jgi:uncharacterized membrane protein
MINSELIFKVLLAIHIVAGSIGLLTGTINIIRKKGDVPHKNLGKFFLYGMIINGFAGMIMSLIHINYFLFIIGVFSVYMVATGQRYFSLKGLGKEQKPKMIDWILTYSMLIFALIFISFGIYSIVDGNNFGSVLIVFGIISILMVKKDIANYQGKINAKNFWLLLHLQRMTGAYIAATTAFLVVNNTLLPGIVAWLLPTVIITPLIFKWSYKYKIALK